MLLPSGPAAGRGCRIGLLKFLDLNLNSQILESISYVLLRRLSTLYSVHYHHHHRLKYSMPVLMSTATMTYNQASNFRFAHPFTLSFVWYAQIIHDAPAAMQAAHHSNHLLYSPSTHTHTQSCSHMHTNATNPGMHVQVQVQDGHKYAGCGREAIGFRES